MMTKLKNELFHDILTWLGEVHTDPLLLNLIREFWYGRNMVFEEDSSPILISIYQILKEIGVHQMWMGLIPINLVETQQSYYEYIGSKKVQKSGV